MKDTQARNRRKVQQGVVLSTKMQKTAVISVSEKIRHPKYGKLVERRKKYYAHNETENLKEGDRVQIMETRPLSKLKRWRIMQVIEVRDET